MNLVPIEDPEVALIELLEELTESAHAGEIVSIAVVTRSRMRVVGSTYLVGSRDELCSMIGEAELLKQRMVDEVRRQNAGPV